MMVKPGPSTQQEVPYAIEKANYWVLTFRYPLLAACMALGGVLCVTVARHGLHWDQETALFPWLMHNGWVLYRDIRDQHGPLFPAILAVLPDPGSASTQFAVTVVLVALITALLALAAWRTGGPVAALLAVGLYALWIIPFDGVHLWYDLGLAPFYLGAYLLGWRMLNKPEDTLGPVALGLLMGAAVLLKQQALPALLGGFALMPLRSNRSLRSIALYLGAASLPVVVSLLAFAAVGALGDYLYWAGIYNVSSNYVQEGSGPVPAADWIYLLAIFAPVLALVLALAGSSVRDLWGKYGRVALFTGSLLVAATLPAWPRYARFHLAAAFPLLAMIGGVAIWTLVRRFPGKRVAALLPWAGGVLLILFTLRMTGPSGARVLLGVWQSQPAPLPYSDTANSLRNWVQANSPAGQPVLVYDLDSTLYRVIDRLPPRPWSPVFSWILEGDSTSSQWVQGIETARPRIALVPSEFVRGIHPPIADAGRSEAFLRANYVEGPHFTLQKYPDSGPQEIVALQLSTPR